MNNQLFKGIFVGIVAPVAAFIVYVAFFTDNPDPLLMFHKLIAIDRLTHVMSLSVIINLVIFFMKIQTGRDDAARGIVFATFIYAFVIMILTII